MLPLFALKGAAAAKSALTFATQAELVKNATNRFGKFAHDVEEDIVKLATNQQGVPSVPGTAPAVTVVQSGVAEPAIAHPELVLKHRKTPGWFVRKLVKVRFEAPGGTEYLWVQVLGVPRKMVGRVASAPVLVDAHMGDMVTFPMGDVVDVQVDGKRPRRRHR
jgi:hypothetical protein